jgi:hypothetical protein
MSCVNRQLTRPTGPHTPTFVKTLTAENEKPLAFTLGALRLGVGDGFRTRDFRIHNPALYP